MRLRLRILPHFALVAYAYLIVESSLALLPTKSLHRNLPKTSVTSSRSLVRSSTKSSITMYFDDASRGHGQQQWEPEKSGLQLPKQTEGTPFSQSAEDEKLDAIQRMLIGYNAETASKLSKDQIMDKMQVWASRFGVVGNYFGDEVFDEMLGTSVCNATSLVGGLAQFWAAIVEVIDASTDEFSPQRWTTGNEDNWRSSKQREDGVIPEQVHFVVFPNCPELYDYKNMFTFVMSMEFSKEQCLCLGKKFLLTLFHPKFKNSPKMFSPERHSPFPSSGLHFGDRTPSIPAQKEPTIPKRQRGNLFTTKKNNGKKKAADDDEEDEDSEIVDRKIRDLDLQRTHLEVLFNVAAVSGSDAESIVSPETTFRQQQESRRRVISPAEVRALSETWIAQHSFLDASRRQPNKALQFAGTVIDDGWEISSHKMAEKVYADIWKAVSELYEIGRAAEREQGEELPKEAKMDGAKEPFDWMKTISRSFQPNQNEEPLRRSDIKSTMFVAMKFCAFNAPAFKRFAITVNAPLKRLTNGKMFLEVFHPEYVGNNEYSNVLRRSPFPMIQICYEISKS